MRYGSRRPNPTFRRHTIISPRDCNWSLICCAAGWDARELMAEVLK